MATNFYNSATNIDKLAQNVVQLLSIKGCHIATCESCTGGLVSGAITSVSGASDVFDVGICTYANEAKMKYAAVPEQILLEHGAVSEQCARAMAEGIMKNADADFGLATTGIAGPSGGTPDKPVGTVYIAAASRGKTVVNRCEFHPGEDGDVSERQAIRLCAVSHALKMAATLIDETP